jgi:hypothetical protein
MKSYIVSIRDHKGDWRTVCTVAATSKKGALSEAAKHGCCLNPHKGRVKVRLMA